MRNKSQGGNSIVSGSMAADITGRGIDMRGARGFFMDASWSGGGSPVGVLHIQHAMEDVDVDYKTIASWNISGDDSETCDWTAFSGRFVRGKYVRGSGTGTMILALNRKE